MLLKVLDVQWIGSENPLGLKAQQWASHIHFSSKLLPKMTVPTQKREWEGTEKKDGLLLLMVCQHKAFIKLLPKGRFEVCATQRGCGSTEVFHFIIILTAPSPLIIPLVQVKVLGHVHEGSLLGVRKWICNIFHDFWSTVEFERHNSDPSLYRNLLDFLILSFPFNAILKSRSSKSKITRERKRAWESRKLYQFWVSKSKTSYENSHSGPI